MFLYKDKHGLIKIHIGPPATSTTALALEMQDVRDRSVVIVESHFLGAKTEVQIFAIHEKVFIKAIQLFINIAADAEKRAAYGIDLDHLIGIGVCHVVARQRLAFREK